MVGGTDKLRQQNERPIQEKYKLVDGSFWTTSKAGTVLTIKTMFKINVETGETSYLNEGVWYITR